jgi:NAD(P)-dependent dehydrogenase (short-subunit alcohol dehydrogenase family)
MENTQNKKKLITILITGANKGIGYGIVKSLLNSQIRSSIWKYKIILTSRDEKKGLDAINELKENLFKIENNQKENSKENFNNINTIKEDFLLYKKLDITNKDSINGIIKWIKEELGDIDILVNNAGVAFKGDIFNLNVFDVTFSTNLFGTIDITEKFLNENLIKNSGKIIIIGSAYGNLKKLGINLLKEFQNKKMEISELLILAKKFRDSIEIGNYIEEGWVKNIYKVSKMCINKYADILGNRESVLNKNIQVYSCCPGWVRTDMGGPNGHRSIEEGVICPIYLIELELNNENNKDFQGKFFKYIKKCKVSNIGI